MGPTEPGLGFIIFGGLAGLGFIIWVWVVRGNQPDKVLLGVFWAAFRGVRRRSLVINPEGAQKDRFWVAFLGPGPGRARAGPGPTAAAFGRGRKLSLRGTYGEIVFFRK